MTRCGHLFLARCGLFPVIRRLQRFHWANTRGEFLGTFTGFFAPLRFARFGGLSELVFSDVAERVDDSQVFFDLAGDGLRGDSMFLVEFFLEVTAAICLVDGLLQAFGHVVREQEDGAVHVAACAAHRLDEAPVIAEETFLVGVENRDHAHFGEVEAFAQEVDAHEHVKFATAQSADKFVAFERLDVRMEVFGADARFDEKFRKVLRHLLGERRDEHAVAVLDDFFDAVQEHVHLALDWEQLDFRVQKSGRTVDLFGHNTASFLEFVIAGRSAHKKHLLRVHVLEFGEVHRTVVESAGETESVLHKRGLAGFVAFGHAAHLRNADMRFVDHQKPVIAKVVDERKGAGARSAVFDDAGVVFDAVAHAGFAEHFHVVAGAARKAGRFQHFAFFVEFGEAFGQFQLDALQHACAVFFFCHKVLGRGNRQFFDFLDDFASDDVEAAETVDFVAEKFNAEAVFVVTRVDFNDVATDAERASVEAKVVARILNVDKVTQNLVAVVNVALLDADHQVEVFARATQTVNAAHGSDDDDIAAGEEVCRGAQAELVDFVVDARVFFDERVRVRNVGFGLEVIVIAHEVFDRVVREERLEFLIKLGGERLVVREDERWLTDILDDICHRERFAGSRHAEERLELFAVLETFGQFFDGFRLVAGSTVRAHEIKICTRGRLELLEFSGQALGRR